MELKKYKLADIAKIEISGVDKKTIEGETPVRLCNFVDVYYNWAITKEKAKSFMVASAKQTEIDKCSIGKGGFGVIKLRVFGILQPRGGFVFCRFHIGGKGGLRAQRKNEQKRRKGCSQFFQFHFQVPFFFVFSYGGPANFSWNNFPEIHRVFPFLR